VNCTSCPTFNPTSILAYTGQTIKFAGQCRLIELGLRQGGPAGYGLRRVLIDKSGSVKEQMSRGEHKSLQADRVILQPGPDAEVAIVNQIYRWFVEGGLFKSGIADRLNTKGILTDLDRAWTRATVREVLSNEKYIGNNVCAMTNRGRRTVDHLSAGLPGL